MLPVLVVAASSAVRVCRVAAFSCGSSTAGAGDDDDGDGANAAALVAERPEFVLIMHTLICYFIPNLR